MGGIELLNPWALALIGGLPLLLLAYRRRRDTKAFEVSSLLVIRRLSRTQPPRQKFKPPWTALLELVALLLLIASAALPLRSEDPIKIALLLDNSLSTSRIANESPLLKLVQDQARQAIDQYSSSANFTVFATSPELQQFGLAGLAVSEAKAQLAEIKLSLTADNLERAVNKIVTQQHFDELLIVTDRHVDMLPGEQAALNTTKTSIRIAPLLGNARTNNLYLSPFRVLETGPNTPRRLIGELYAFGTVPNETLLQVSGSASPDMADLTPLQTVTVRFDNRSTAGVDIALAEVANNFRLLKIEIVSPKNSPANEIREDDISWISTDLPSSAKLLLVSPSSSDAAADSFGLARLRQFSSRTVSPAEFSELDPEQLRSHALIIFHRTAPAVPPPVPSLLIAPPVDNQLFPAKLRQTSPPITSWREEHPILSYLRVPLLSPADSMILTTPPWANSVINAADGSLLSAGEARGVRLAACGFELLPFEGSGTPSISILTLNLIRWLTKKESLGDSVLVGSELTLAADLTLIVSDPNSRVSTIESTINEPPRYRYTTPGPHLISIISGGETASIASQSRLIAANVFFPEESGQASTISLPATVSSDIAAKERPLGRIWYWLACVALLLMLLEYVFRNLNLRSQRFEGVSSN